MKKVTVLEPHGHLPHDALTVAGLIAALRTLPQDAVVFWPGGGGVETQPITNETFRLRQMGVDRYDWQGEDEVNWHEVWDEPDRPTIPGVMIL